MLDFSACHVLVVGDVMLDRYLYGSVERISPEAPVPVFSRGRESAMPGGAGNVARNITALGARATLIGLVGARSDALREAIAAAGITDALVESATRPTTTKLRVVAGNQQMIRIDDEATGAQSEAETTALLAAIDAALAARPDAVIVSDYGKGVLSTAILAQLRATGVPIFVDPKGADFSRYAGATCITPNAAEMALAAALPTKTDEECAAAARAVMARDGVSAILVTRSAKGMMLVRPDAALSIPARAQEVFDVSGAGDTVIAALALAHAGMRNLEDAMRIANAAAGIVVAKLGTATTTAAELTAALAGGAGEAGSALLDLAATRALVAQWKAAGLSVGFANGCFDILHAGHVAMLAQAAAGCDRLVVALNSDASVARLKGPSRPVNRLEDRAAVIAALRQVAAVTSFSEDTPLATITALLPDVLIKGADYTAETVVGWPEVRANGGRLLLAELLPGRSTTAILAGR
jgi:D-beta-D-heptose 7-phosphate kinase/D-beta-D-heptose 1-phosphate adenosyltransferase